MEGGRIGRREEGGTDRWAEGQGEEGGGRRGREREGRREDGRGVWIGRRKDGGGGDGGQYPRRWRGAWIGRREGVDGGTSVSTFSVFCSVPFIDLLDPLLVGQPVLRLFGPDALLVLLIMVSLSLGTC
jgi:hypothetical protein